MVQAAVPSARIFADKNVALKAHRYITCIFTVLLEGTRKDHEPIFGRVASLVSGIRAWFWREPVESSTIDCRLTEQTRLVSLANAAEVYGADDRGHARLYRRLCRTPNVEPGFANVVFVDLRGNAERRNPASFRVEGSSECSCTIRNA